MGRRVYLLGVGLALVALALALTDWAVGPRPGVTEANLRRLKPGMTLAEVQAVFGGRPSVWTPTVLPNVFPPALPHDLPPGPQPPGAPGRVAGQAPPLPQVGWHGAWDGADGCAVAYFDLSLRFQRLDFIRNPPGSQSGPLARLRRRLGW
jgi:hypothetical protein